MVYQNNNNRIVPDEVKNTRIEPVAHPVNQEVKYTPDLTKAAQWKNTADSLARLGRGTLEFDAMMRNSSKDDALIAFEKTEAEGGNKRDWAEVSKNLKGMAKYNPYVRESFQQLVAQDIYNASVIKTVSNPNLMKMSSEQYQTFIQQTKDEMLTAMEESGLRPRNFHDYVEKFATHCDNLDKSYASKNSQYVYDNYLIKSTNNLATNLRQSVYGLNTDEEKLLAIQNTINETVQQMSTETGTPDDDLAQKVITNALKTFIYTDDNVNAATLEGAVKGLTVNGKPIQDFIPNFDAEVHEMIIQAKRAKFADRQLEHQDRQLTLQINSEQANREFFQTLIKNPNMTSQDYENLVFSLAEKYGLEENGLSFLSGLTSTRATLNNLRTTTTDPDTWQNLGMKLATGELTTNDIGEAMQSGTLNVDDGLKLFDRLEKDKAKAKTLTDKNVQNHMQQLKLDINGNGKNIKPVYSKDIGNRLWQQAEELQSQYEQGNIDYNTFNNELAKLKTVNTRIQEIEKSQGNLSQMLNSPEISEQAWREAHDMECYNAVKKLGLMRNNRGLTEKNTTVVSAPSKNRIITVNGKKQSRPHKGYDLAGAYNGRALYSPDNGTVVFSGMVGTYGNVTMIQTNDGRYVKIAHMQSAGLLPKGTKVNSNTVIGYVGNTGNADSTGCVHVEFFNKNRQWIPMENFVNKRG
jgi:murein DD-endopeptidase MepM/ murein hydrolase activator NlpD